MALICPIHHVDSEIVCCGCEEQFLTMRAQLQVNYWRWRAESSEWARIDIPEEWRFLAVPREVCAL